MTDHDHTPSEQLSAIQRELADLHFAIHAGVPVGRAQVRRRDQLLEDLAALTAGWECEHCGCTNDRACPGGCH